MSLNLSDAFICLLMKRTDTSWKEDMMMKLFNIVFVLQVRNALIEGLGICFWLIAVNLVPLLVCSQVIVWLFILLAGKCTALCCPLLPWLVQKTGYCTETWRTEVNPTVKGQGLVHQSNSGLFLYVWKI